MKLVRFSYNGRTHKGVLNGRKITVSDSPKKLDLDKVNLLAPVKPSKIVLVGLNYRDHAEELNMKVPVEPVIFLKPSSAVIGSGEKIIYPSTSNRVDYEAELGIVIKNKSRNIKEEEVFSCIAGYVCFNDVTARDLQKKDIQWTRAKSFDTFAPLGPWIETELNPENLNIRSYLNGELKQNSNTSEFIFKIPKLITFISCIMTLFPGDIIATGTPPNVGSMKKGDEIIVEIEGIGQLKNYVV